MAEAVRYVGRYSWVHRRERGAVEDKGLTAIWWLNEQSGLFRKLKANPDFVANSPSEAAEPQRFGVKG
jgi:hypothetical protein